MPLQLPVAVLLRIRIPVHAQVEPAGANEKAPRGGGNKAGNQVVVKPAIDGDSDDEESDDDGHDDHVQAC